MEHDSFLHKITCELAVITNELDCHTVTKELNIQPERFFNKGDQITSKHSSRIGSRPHGLWAIRSKPVISQDLNVSQHIDYFRELLGEKLDIIKNLKNRYNFDCVFAIVIETEDAGVGFDLNELELSFIKNICTRYSCTFIAKKNINK